MTTRDEALAYHSRPPAGKIEIRPTKPCLTQRDLALAYTPGVAEPCREIEANPEEVFKYTARGNLVAVVSNGTAVLGLGDIGPLAGKPVMEGKALLFKRFADIDAIDIELATKAPTEIIRTVQLLEPTFGGINLEDIKAPECFEIEEALRATMQIPVFHDDQHGTAIISGAALLNALELVGKRIEQVNIVFSGAGAAAIATARFYCLLGARKENITIVDSKGVIYVGRKEGMNRWKQEFATETSARSLAEAMRGADVFVGLSVAGLVTEEMLRSMAAKPIVFALANPDPEIPYDVAKAVRPDAIVATGRSDYPNQVNNVLGFPFIFRGALDVRARQINEQMKVAAAKALAALARESVPETVAKAYGLETITFGPDYLIPKPLDPRVLTWVAPAVAEAAIESGVARHKLDIAKYREALENRLGRSREIMRIVFHKARTAPKRVVFAEGSHSKILQAARQLVDEKIASPILLGDPPAIEAQAARLQISLTGMRIESLANSPNRDRYARRIFELRCRKGVTLSEAFELVRDPNYYASAMVEQGDADVMISGIEYHYPDGLRPPMRIIGVDPKHKTAAGVYLIITKQRTLFFADTTVNIDLDAERMARVAVLTANLARSFGVEPRVAMLSFSNFGSVRHPRTEMVQQAVKMARQLDPTLQVDGELQANTALNAEHLNETYPFNILGGEANVLIFPNLEAGNIGYKLVARLADAELVGPILVGMKKPVHILQRGDEVKDIVNLTAIAVIGAQ
ncbi:MAG: NADP-dependent malic enzyme [Candidatus Sumerlaeaceae bacterium]